MDDYDKIIQNINNTYKTTKYQTIENYERVIENEWIFTQHELKRTNVNRARMIVRIMLITYQLNTLIAGNAPKLPMNWKRMWKYIKKQSILMKKNTNILEPYWLNNRYGKIRSNTESLDQLVNTKDQVVYYFANLWTKHAYVGETNNKMGWQYRIQQEIRTAKKVYYSRHKTTRQKIYRYADRIMGYMGFFTWCVMPIYTLNKDSTKQDRLQKEKEAIQRLQPTMNTKHTWSYKWDRTFLRKKNGRHQRWRRLRNANMPTKYYKNTMTTSTKFETKQDGEWKRVTSLSKLLMNTKSGEKLHIRKNKFCAHNDWTNYTHAQEFHRDTIFSSTTGEHFTLKELDTSSLRKNKDDQYYVTVRKTKPMERWKEQIILKMQTHRNAKNKTLIKLTFQELYELYTSVDAYVQDEKEKEE